MSTGPLACSCIRSAGASAVPASDQRDTEALEAERVYWGMAYFDWDGRLLWQDPLTGRGIAPMSLGLPGNVRHADRDR
ncbi:MAG: hypothetical protein KF718_33045 [Polyangiaceae bacterium]|nr:hypothetical protein [Polyangiaceae bacterium]